MCKYCKPLEQFGDTFMVPLPGTEKSGNSMFVTKENGGKHYLSVYYPPFIAGPINYCPICGRKLVSE